VVIAIISILMSILLPALKGARNMARQTTCMNNMKQIGLGLAQYASDNNEYRPAVWHDWLNENGGTTIKYIDDLSPYITSGLNPNGSWLPLTYRYPHKTNVAVCPMVSMNPLQYVRTSSQGIYPTTSPNGEVGYSYAPTLGNPGATPEKGGYMQKWKNLGGAAGDGLREYFTFKTTDPRTALLFEGAINSNGRSDGGYNLSDYSWNIADFDYITIPHNKGANFLFGDLHVTRYSIHTRFSYGIWNSSGCSWVPLE